VRPRRAPAAATAALSRAARSRSVLISPAGTTLPPNVATRPHTHLTSHDVRLIIADLVSALAWARTPLLPPPPDAPTVADLLGTGDHCIVLRHHPPPSPLFTFTAERPRNARSHYAQRHGLYPRAIAKVIRPTAAKNKRYATSDWPVMPRSAAVPVRLHALVAAAAGRGAAPYDEREWAATLLRSRGISSDALTHYAALCAKWRKRNARHQARPRAAPAALASLALPLTPLAARLWQPQAVPPAAATTARGSPLRKAARPLPQMEPERHALVWCHVCGNAACMRAGHMASDTHSVDQRMIHVHTEASVAVVEKEAGACADSAALPRCAACCGRTAARHRAHATRQPCRRLGRRAGGAQRHLSAHTAAWPLAAPPSALTRLARRRQRRVQAVPHALPEHARHVTACADVARQPMIGCAVMTLLHHARTAHARALSHATRACLRCCARVGAAGYGGARSCLSVNNPRPRRQQLGCCHAIAGAPAVRCARRAAQPTASASWGACLMAQLRVWRGRDACADEDAQLMQRRSAPQGRSCRALPSGPAADVSPVRAAAARGRRLAQRALAEWFCAQLHSVRPSAATPLRGRAVARCHVAGERVRRGAGGSPRGGWGARRSHGTRGGAAGSVVSLVAALAPLRAT